MLNETYKDQYIAQQLPGVNGDIPKRDRYNWKDVNNPGVFMLIEKQRLIIDRRYQRGSVSEKKILDIARDWDWTIFGALSVVKRYDGYFYIYDGGHRWRASQKRDDVELLPCMVFEMSSVKEEAEAFIKTNTMKANVSAYHMYKAGVEANDPLSIKTKELLDNYGYNAAKDAGKRSLAAISTLKKMVKKDYIIADKVFALCVKMSDAHDEHISSSVMRAIFYTARFGDQDIFSQVWYDKMLSIGIKGIESAFTREKHIFGKGGERIEAMALCNLLNKNKRSHKIQLKE